MLVVLVTATATAIAHRRPNEPGQPAADEAPRAEDAKPAEAVIAELPKNS